MVGRQSTIWNLRSKNAVWPCLRWAGRCDRSDGVDGVLCNDRFSWRGLERRKHLRIRPINAACRYPSPHIRELRQPIHERACTDPLLGAGRYCPSQLIEPRSGWEDGSNLFTNVSYLAQTLFCVLGTMWRRVRVVAFLTVPEPSQPSDSCPSYLPWT